LFERKRMGGFYCINNHGKCEWSFFCAKYSPTQYTDSFVGILIW
jgi:hypothetical protein